MRPVDYLVKNVGQETGVVATVTEISPDDVSEFDYNLFTDTEVALLDLFERFAGMMKSTSSTKILLFEEIVNIMLSEPTNNIPVDISEARFHESVNSLLGTIDYHKTYLRVRSNRQRKIYKQKNRKDAKNV